MRSGKPIGLPLFKKKGQNFLLNSYYLSRISASAKIEKDEDVLEIGAGIGNLTAFLARKARKVLAVEIDRRFKPFLTKNLRNCHNVVILWTDFLKMNLEDITEHIQIPFKVVSNIPFSITAPILDKLCSWKPHISLAVLTVQREVAEKMEPPPSHNITPLSLFVNYHFQVEVLFGIPRGAFHPPPEVDARVVRLFPRSSPPVEVEDEEDFFDFIRKLFQHRRKTLKNILRILGYPISNPPFPLERRAEELDWEELRCLYLWAKK